MLDRLHSTGSGHDVGSRWIAAGIAGYVAVFALITSTGLLDRDAAANLTNALSFSVLLASAAAVIRLTIRRDGGTSRMGWLLVGAALLAFGLGELVWTILDATMDAPPVPSLADVAYIAFVPMMLAGILLVFQPRRRRDQLELLADTLAFALVAVALLWMLVLQPLLVTTDAAPEGIAVLAFYPATDLVLVIAVVLGFLSRSRMRTSTAVTFTAGLLLFLVGDLAFAWLSLDAAYQSGSFTDVGWSLGALLIAWSRVLTSDATDRSTAVVRAPTWASAVLLMAPIIGFLLVDQLATPTPIDTITRLAPVWLLLLIAALIGGARVAHLVRARAAAATAAEALAVELAARNAELAARYRSLAEVDRLKDRLIAAAEEASQAKTAFLAAMSHEIRTPLHGIIGALELLRDVPVEAPVRAQLDSIGGSAERQLRIVDAILDVTRVEAGGLDLHPEAVDPVALLDEIMALHRAAALLKGLALTVEVDPALPARLLADQHRLGEIVSNLTGNALRFTERGEVRVSLSALAPTVAQDPPAASPVAAPTVRLTVSDTGPGIPAGLLDRVFEPFFQADGTTARRHGGAGLGLTLTHRLVELVGGTIEVSSVEGVGTTFTVLLPLPSAGVPETAQSTVAATVGDPVATQHQAALAAPSDVLRVLRQPADGAIATEATVLVVEDDPVGAHIAVSLLRRSGRPAVVATDGPAALRALGEQRFGLVLMDLQLPGMDGCAVTRALRRRERVTGSPPVPVVAVSADAYEEARQACAAAGMDGHLSKPYRADDLSRALELFAPLAPRAVDEGSPDRAAGQAPSSPRTIALPDLHPNRNRASTEVAPARP